MQVGACENPDARYFCGMPMLTRREQLLVAFVVLAFCVGLGVKQWREAQAIAPYEASASR